jgi:hypothetical protein
MAQIRERSSSSFAAVLAEVDAVGVGAIFVGGDAVEGELPSPLEWRGYATVRALFILRDNAIDAPAHGATRAGRPASRTKNTTSAFSSMEHLWNVMKKGLLAGDTLR